MFEQYDFQGQINKMNEQILLKKKQHIFDLFLCKYILKRKESHIICILRKRLHHHNKLLKDIRHYTFDKKQLYDRGL